MKAARRKRECVAYVDGDGDLVVKAREGDGFCMSSEYGVVHSDFIEGDAVHKFYPGDKLTITF
jgi:hypothetical protein